ncbi:MAG: 4-(cytidine 5'-diphospho)-2-C-methyl-D-erythritol kinase [Candidatus Omnitrophica bacterium]|nr:4-(cytidine 5'-diphospho)-2-C-methyl-D-erythritol kinase [Candidatus Omnitrophota bacterium]
MNRIVLSSPAKLNLLLRVQNKRPDGYHNIVTLFERISLSDEIDFRHDSNKSIHIVCDHPDVPVGPKNLVYKAAQLLQRELGVDQGVKIKIKKRIPVAAGLAGGSSNAATALLGLNHIWKLNLSKAKLLSYARKIGSDVAFFLHDASWGLGTQRGDQIKTLNIKTKLWHILVVPRIKMYSWKIYGGLKMHSSQADFALKKSLAEPARRVSQSEKGESMNVLTKINDDVNILIRNLKKDNVLEVGRLLANDLETEILRLSPRLEKLKKRLKSLNTKGVMISGSGPAVFGLTMTKGQAELIRSVLSKRFAQVFVVETL